LSVEGGDHSKAENTLWGEEDIPIPLQKGENFLTPTHRGAKPEGPAIVAPRRVQKKKKKRTDRMNEEKRKKGGGDGDR